ncbi:hypothetical protein ACIQI7_01515 [Kitasatospora sp. NPDC092039]|uniref:hypothetical protein n=1 Tax=Kitasatospora sp. NPDC092039 TaxID=3364086 RepID=UPI00380A15FB
MNGERHERPLHDMGGAIGPADTAGTERDEERTEGPGRRPSPIGKGGTPNVAGSDVQQPEIAEGPVPGVQPDEEYGGPQRSPTGSAEPPDGPAQSTAAAGAPESTEAVEPLEEPEEPERGRHDPGAEPEDEGIPDLQDGSPARTWSQDPQVQPVPGDAPVAAESFGTTGAEQAEGESLDARLAQEEPETDERTAVAGEPEQAAGRLDPPDPHSDLRADATGDTAGLSAEEEAVRIRSDGGAEPGATGAGPYRRPDEEPGIEAPESVEGVTGDEDAEGDRPPRT